MKISFFDAMLFFQWGCMLASGIFSIRLIAKSVFPSYMNKFYWYSVVAATLAITNFLEMRIHFMDENIFNIVINVLLLFHFLFLSLFINRVLPDKKKPKYAKLFLSLFLVLIIVCIIVKKIYQSQPLAYSFVNFGLVLFCCIYYIQLFREIPKADLLKEPSFWVVNGVFFCMCATIPISSLSDYLHDNLPYDSYLSIHSTVSFAYGVMHLFFIKAYLLCSTSHPKA